MALTYTANLVARPIGELRDPVEIQKLAYYWRSQGLSGEMTYQALEDEIFAFHEGDLFNVKDDWLDPDRLRPSQLWPARVLRHNKTLRRMSLELWGDKLFSELELEMGDLFGADRRGTINKFMRYAKEPPGIALSEQLVARIMFIDFATRIRIGRLHASSGGNDLEGSPAGQ